MKRSIVQRLARAHRHGFTLVELMIAVAIIAILAAVLAPSVSTYIRRSQGKSVARQVANTLRMAHNQAMSRGEVIIATVTTNNGLADSGGSVVLSRTDNQLADSDCAASSDDEFAETTDPSCFARSCAQAQSMTLTEVFTLDLADVSNDMMISGTDPGPASNQLTLCFAPSGRVMDMAGLPLESANSDCEAVNTRIFVRSAEVDGGVNDNPLSGPALDACVAVDASDQSTVDQRQLQKDGRDLTNFYSIYVPYNGAIAAKQ